MQTAVEWFTEKLFNEFGFACSDNIIEQAKEMEKKQIIEAFKEGTKMVNINDELSAGFNAVMYFYETYDSGMSENPNDHIVDPDDMV